MNRRGFFSRLSQAVAGAVLTAHFDFGRLMPVPESVTYLSFDETGYHYTVEVLYWKPISYSVWDFEIKGLEVK